MLLHEKSVKLQTIQPVYQTPCREDELWYSSVLLNQSKLVTNHEKM